MRITRKHNMSKEAAKARVVIMMPGLIEQYGGSLANADYSWQGDELEFSGRILVATVKGRLRVTDIDMVLDLDGIPFFVAGKARSDIERWFDSNWPP